jgi:F0F1-type ATP synthase membrane subunit b/b'
MEKLENTIRNKRREFDCEEPSDGHLERFQMKMADFRKPVKSHFSLRPVMKIAAVILVIITLTFLVNYFNLVPARLFNNVAANEVPAELKEVESYYSVLNEKKLEQIEQLAGSKSEAERIKKQAINEMTELQNTTSELQQQYTKEGKSERVFDAIVNNYRIINNLLDHIIEELSDDQSTMTKNQPL